MWRKEYKYIIPIAVFLFITGIIFVWQSCVYSGSSSANSYNVLMIQSFRSDNPWGEDLKKGLEDAFKAYKLDGRFKIVYLDSEQLEEEKQLQAIQDFLEDNHIPDLIITCGDQATEVLLSSRHSLTYKVPIVFCGVDYYEEKWLDNRKNVTGYTTPPDYAKTLELIRLLYPDMEGIAIDIDDSPLSVRAVDELQAQMASFSEDMDIQINNMDVSWGRTFMWSATFANKYPRIMPVWSSFYSSRARDTEVPFFAVNSNGIGHGYLGGYITLPYDQAYEAALTGVRIIQGSLIRDFPIQQSPKALIFDWKQIQKCGIPKDKLPEESVIINITFFERYESQLVSIIILIVLLILSISFLLIYLYRKAQEAKKKTQQELTGHRTRLKIVMSSIREGVISINKELNIFAINPAALHWLQLKGNENMYIGRNITSLLDILPAGDVGDLKTMVHTLFDRKLSVSLEAADFTSKLSNYTFPVSGSISAIYQNEELYGAVLVFHDVSEEVAQKEFLGLTLSVGDVIPWHLDFINRTIVFDPSFFEKYEIDDDGTHAMTIEHLARLIHPEDVTEWQNINEQLISGLIDTLSFEMRVDVNGKGYQWWDMRYTSLPSLTPGGLPAIFGLVRNVQEEKEALHNLEQARDKAQLSDKLKSAFLANMSHEIRTPLNAIVGFSNVLTSGEDFEPEERQIFIETIRNNCNLLLALISDVLDLAQIETGSMVFKEEVCDVNELISQIVITQRVIIPEHLKISANIPQETIYIVTDKLRLNQVLTNLINNAVKFTEKGGVTVGYTKENDEILHFFVEDTGKGIPEKDLDNIFERFFKKDDFKQGAGLGLSICKMIVDRFNGEISVTSKVGVGSRFTVSLPLIKADSSEETGQSIFTNSNTFKLIDMNTETTDALKQDRVTLLIAEDEESNYLLLKTILQKHCNLIRAKTGKEALEKFQENTVDLIMLDIKMPEMTGIEALKEIRKISTTIPIIMQSAYVFDSDMESARQAGASDFITKPINLKILKETLSKYCPSLTW